MSTLNIFTVEDLKAEACLTPFFSQTAGTAIRSFEQACNQAEHDFHNHAEDYVLYELGTFDQGTGALVAHDKPIKLCRAIDCLDNVPSRPQEVHSSL